MNAEQQEAYSNLVFQCGCIHGLTFRVADHVLNHRFDELQFALCELDAHLKRAQEHLQKLLPDQVKME